MTAQETKDPELKLRLEVKNLTAQIIAQKRRLHHRHVLYKHSGIPTSRKKLDLMEERLFELTWERETLMRGISNIQQGYSRRCWNYSDTLLAFLQKVCEDNGCPDFVRQAREITKKSFGTK